MTGQLEKAFNSQPCHNSFLQKFTPSIIYTTIFFHLTEAACQLSILHKAVLLQFPRFLGSTLTHQTGPRVPQPTLREPGKQKRRANTTYANATYANTTYANTTYANAPPAEFCCELSLQEEVPRAPAPALPGPTTSAHAAMTSAALTRVETNFLDGLVLAAIHLAGRLH